MYLTNNVNFGASAPHPTEHTGRPQRQPFVCVGQRSGWRLASVSQDPAGHSGLESAAHLLGHWCRERWVRLTHSCPVRCWAQMHRLPLSMLYLHGITSLDRPQDDLNKHIHSSRIQIASPIENARNLSLKSHPVFCPGFICICFN